MTEGDWSLSWGHTTTQRAPVLGYNRGDYTPHPMHDTPMRVVESTDDRTVWRYCWGWRWVETAAAWWEDRILWPLQDLFKR